MNLNQLIKITIITTLLTLVLSLFISNSVTGQESFNQAQAIVNLNQEITGKENQAAETVFKNIQILKGMPATRLLKIMEFGYSRALGVSCTHCHVAGQWEKEDLATKQIARDMIKMQQNINNELKTIKNLKTTDAFINCTSCHRGQIKPAINLL